MKMMRFFLCASAALLLQACRERATSPTAAEPSSTAAPPSSASAVVPRAETTPFTPELKADSRVPDLVRHFQSTADPEQRSQLLDQFVELTEHGVPNREAAQALGGLLKSEPSTDVKLDIMDSLLQIDDPSVIDQLALGLSPEQPSEVRSGAVDALGDTEDKRAIPLLQQAATRDPDPDIREDAAEAVRLLKESAK